MPLYQLFLHSSSNGPSEAVQFTGDNAGHALELAHRHGFEGRAELWCDGRRLCNIEYSDKFGYWTIIPAASASKPPPEPSNDVNSEHSPLATAGELGLGWFPRKF